MPLLSQDAASSCPVACNNASRPRRLRSARRGGGLQPFSLAAALLCADLVSQALALMSRYAQDFAEALGRVLDGAQPRVGESPPSFFTDVTSHDLRRVAECSFKLAGAVLDNRARAGEVAQQLDG